MAFYGAVWELNKIVIVIKRFFKESRLFDFCALSAILYKKSSQLNRWLARECRKALEGDWMMERKTEGCFFDLK